MRFPELPYNGTKQTIVKNQSTEDIVHEVLRAHAIFSKDYDKLAAYFAATVAAPEDMPAALFDFCKLNIRYKIEPEKLQTTRSPGAMLYMGSGDCKHYAGFIGGVVDALNRMGYDRLPWCYRFASYDIFNPEPVHVFIVLFPGSKKGEIWVDPVLPTLDARNPSPSYFTDKTPRTMSMVRISGPGAVGNLAQSITSVLGTSTNYDVKATALAEAGNLITANIPFYSLAKGIITNFLGPGGLSDWLTPEGILNELKFALSGRLYRGDQYWLGEKFRFYILGEDIHTRDADVVTDGAVETAMNVFSVGFGVPITSYEDILNLQTGRDAYISRYVRGGAPQAQINVNAVDRAVQLKRLYFPTDADTIKKGPPPAKWDANNFNRIPLVAPIPNYMAPVPQMWSQTYSGKTPGGEVREGIIIAGPGAAGAGLPANPAAAGGLSIGTLLLIGGGLVGAYFLFKKSRR